jgi:hypothetical protein
MLDFRAYLGDRSLARTTALLLVLATAGCDDVGNNYPVIGRVLVNGQALQGMEGSVMFKPDAGQGNTSLFEAIGQIDAQGNYKLFTKGKEGTAPGCYKVIVTANQPGQAQAKNRTATGRPRKVSWVIPARYANAATSGLVVEVIANSAGSAYDLHLTK